MRQLEKSLLSCSICNFDLEICGKNGVLLQTRCSNCGINSDSFDESSITKLPQQRGVQVYYNRRAHPSTPPG